MKRLFYPLALTIGANALTAQADDLRPNIIFIMADDLGWTDLGVMGSDYYETPNIDRLASQGLLFTDAYSAAPNSAPSRACLMTGKYTPRHGVFTVSPSARGRKRDRKLIPIENTEDVAPHFTTMAEALQAEGYLCGHIGKWHLGDDKDKTGPLSQGFCVNIAGGRAGTPYSYFYPYCTPDKRKCHVGLEKGVPGEYLTDRLTSEAIRFISSQREKPFFLYLAHHGVHSPLKAPQHLIDKYAQKSKGQHHRNPIYAAMVESIDQSVGRICRTVDSLGIAGNTLIVFYSDNGGSEPNTDNHPLREGKGSPYEGGDRVPLILKWTGRIKADTKSDIPVSGIDFYPTFVKLAKGKPAKDLDGEDIFTLIKKDKRDRTLYWHFPAYLQSYVGNGSPFRATPYSGIRRGDWKLIYYYEDQSMELFNLKEDIGETRNRMEDCPKTGKNLYKRLMKWLKETQAPIPTQHNPAYIPRNSRQ